MPILAIDIGLSPAQGGAPVGVAGDRFPALMAPLLIANGVRYLEESRWPGSDGCSYLLLQTKCLQALLAAIEIVAIVRSLNAATVKIFCVLPKTKSRPRRWNGRLISGVVVDNPQRAIGKLRRISSSLQTRALV